MMFTLPPTSHPAAQAQAAGRPLPWALGMQMSAQLRSHAFVQIVGTPPPRA